MIHSLNIILFSGTPLNILGVTSFSLKSLESSLQMFDWNVYDKIDSLIFILKSIRWGI
jgi:hypothetical protein